MKVKEIIEQNDMNRIHLIAVFDNTNKIDLEIANQKWKDYWDFLNTEYDKREEFKSYEG